MADTPPEAKFQQAGIQASGYSPIKTELAPPIQLQGAGQLWADVGKNALAASKQVFETLSQSRLNPLVRKQMELGIKSAQQGMDTIDWTKAQGDAGYMLGGIQDGRYYQAPAVNAPLNWILKYMPNTPEDQNKEKERTEQEKKKAEEAPTAPPPPGTTPMTPSPEGTGTTRTPSAVTPPGAGTPPAQGGTIPAPNYQSPEYGGPQAQAQPAVNPRSVFASAAPTQPPGPESFQGPTQQQTAAAIQQGLQRNQFAASGQGVPAGYQPPQQPAQQPAPSSAIQQVTDQPGVALANWQQTTQTEPLTADDAMAWIRRQTTKAKHATYLPHGGPQGSPAYAFDMDGGGSNVIPVSQMVQNGAGPAVAAQNTSVVLSKSDQIKQQQADAAAQQQVVAQQPGAQGQPPAPQTVPGGPPPAPNQGPLLASTAYDPEQYRQMVAQQVADTQNLTAQAAPGPGATPPPIPRGDLSETRARTPDTDASFHRLTGLSPDEVMAAAKQVSADQLAKNKVDDASGAHFAFNKGAFDWLKEGPDGEPFAVRPGTTSTYSQQRLYWNSPEWREYPLPKMIQQQNIEREYPMIPQEDIKKMDIREMSYLLKVMWQFKNSTGGDASDATNTGLNAREAVSKDIQQIVDLAKSVDSLKHFNKAQQDVSETAHKAEEEAPPEGADLRYLILHPTSAYHALGSAWNAFWSGGEKPDAVVDYLKDTISHLKTHLTQVSGLKETPPEKSETKASDINVGLGWGLINLSKSQQETMGSTLTAIDNAFRGGDKKAAIDALMRLQHINNVDYANFADSANIAGHRFDPRHLANIEVAKYGHPIPDVDNIYAPRDGSYRNPYATHQSQEPPWAPLWTGIAPSRGLTPATATDRRLVEQRRAELRQHPETGATSTSSQAQASPTPMVEVNSPEDLERFRKKYRVGTPYMGWDPQQHKMVKYYLQ